MTKISRPIAPILSAMIMVTLLLGACSNGGDSQPVVNVPAAGQEQNAVATPRSVEENDALTETLETADTTGISETADGELDDANITVITDTTLITGTEVTTDVIVTTDTVVLEQELITTVITATDLVTNVVESTDTSTTTESEIITDTADLAPETTTGEAEADVDITPIAPTPTVVATPRPDQTPQAQANPVVIVAFIGIEGSTGRSIRASTLLGADFETSDGEVGGEIQDLVIDVQTGQVLYVLLEYGGVLDVGDTDMPVPLSAFRWGAEDEMILNIDGQRLENFPGVGNDWPVADDTDWDLDVRNFWEGVGIDTGFDAQEAQQGVRRASNLFGGLIAADGLGEGSVQDMIISLGEGRVTYVLMSFAGTGVGGDWYAIPFSAFDPTASEEELSLDADFDSSLLDRAPRLNEADLNRSSIFTEGYDDEWRTYWGDAGYSVMNEND